MKTYDDSPYGFTEHSSDWGMDSMHTHLLRCEAFAQAGTLVDDPFGGLEFMDDNLNSQGLADVTLEFCPDAYALLSRVAELLHRPLSELLHGLLTVGGTTLGSYVEEALREEGMFGREMKSWADQAIDFERLSNRYRPPGWCGVEDGWISFNLTRPEKRKALLKLKGG